MNISKTGGPPGSSNLSEWKTGLVAINNTWSLIDHGTTLIPVWELVSYHHKEFRNVNALRQILRTWETFIKLSMQDSSVTPVRELLEVVTGWEDMSHINNLLIHLLQVKDNLARRTMNPVAWASLYLSQPQIQQFLLSVMDQQQTSPSSGYVKLLMK